MPCAICTISPRTAYSELMTRVLMVSIEMGALRAGFGVSDTVVTDGILAGQVTRTRCKERTQHAGQSRCLWQRRWPMDACMQQPRPRLLCTGATPRLMTCSQGSHSEQQLAHTNQAHHFDAGR